MKKLFITLGLGVLLMGTTATAESENSASTIIFEADQDGSTICYYAFPDHLEMFDGEGVYKLLRTSSGSAVATCVMESTEDVVLPRAIVIKDSECFVRTAGVIGPVKGTKSHITILPDGTVKAKCHYNPVQAD